MLQRIAGALSAINEWIGRAVSLLVLVMVAVVAFDVAMRYLFHAGSVALQELEWHLFGIIFLLGAAYTLKHGEHVRVDVVYQSRWLNDRQRAWIDLLGTLVLLIPFCILVIWSSWPFVTDAFMAAERSPDPGGLPFRWILKAVIPLAFILLALQGIAQVLTNLATLRQKR